MNLRRRWVRHRYDLRCGVHDNAHLQAAWNLYGGKAFAFAVLEYVADVGLLLEREQYYLDILQPEYNIVPVAGSMLGFKHSEEARQNMSEAQKGRVFSEEHKRKLSEAHKGHTVSEEARQNMSMAQKGRVHSEATKQKIREASGGRVHSAETRAKMSAAQTPERRARLSAALTGIVRSEETRARISKAKMGQVVSEATKRRVSETHRGERSRTAKLSEQDVMEIKRLLRESVLLQRKIATRYGVGEAAISAIKHGRSWTYLADASGSGPATISSPHSVQ